MAKKKGKKGRRKFKVYVSGWLTAAGLIAPWIKSYMEIKEFPVSEYTYLGRVFIKYTGYDYVTKTFDPAAFMWGGGPIIGGVVMHGVARETEMNKMLGRARVPLIRM